MFCRRLRLPSHALGTNATGMVLLDGLLALLILTAGVAALAAVAVHAMRDSRSVARTSHALRLLQDGAEQQRLDPSGSWAIRWKTDVAHALPNAAGEHASDHLSIRWSDSSNGAARRVELKLAP
jgi:Tfp pilus assembly protein PilV